MKLQEEEEQEEEDEEQEEEAIEEEQDDEAAGGRVASTPPTGQAVPSTEERGTRVSDAGGEAPVREPYPGSYAWPEARPS